MEKQKGWQETEGGRAKLTKCNIWLHCVQPLEIKSHRLTLVGCERGLTHRNLRARVIRTEPFVDTLVAKTNRHYVDAFRGLTQHLDHRQWH